MRFRRFAARIRRTEDMDAPAKTKEKQKPQLFKRGQSGDPSGRPQGSRNKATIAVDALFDGEAETITRKAIELAKAGDTVALRLCLDRLAAPRRDRPVLFDMPPVDTPADIVKASAVLLQPVASGHLLPSEAADLGKLVEAHVKAIELTDVQARL